MDDQPFMQVVTGSALAAFATAQARAAGPVGSLAAVGTLMRTPPNSSHSTAQAWTLQSSRIVAV